MNLLQPHTQRNILSDEKSPPSLSRLVPADRKAVLRERFIEEVADYIVKHSGADPRGLAHPSVKRIKVDILEIALDRARSRGLSEEWKPYHFRGHLGTYSNQLYVDEVVAKRIDSLLKQPYFKGDLIKLATEITYDNMIGPLYDRIGGRTIEVSLHQVASKFGNRLFEMVKRYGEIRGTNVLEELRPYHMQKATYGIYNTPSIVDEVLVKKVDSLLHSPPFNGDLLKLATEVTFEELFAPLYDRIGNTTIEVSMGQIARKYAASPFQVLKRYNDIKGTKVLDDLLPYHMQKAARGTYNDPIVVDEVLVKKIESLLREPRFKGDLLKLATEITHSDLIAPLYDQLNNRAIEVSMGAVVNRFSNSPFFMVKRYCEIKGIKELDELRPYHMQRSVSGTYNDADMINEVLLRKIESLLNGPRFKGDLFKLVSEIAKDDLLTPLYDRIGKRTIEVSMGRVVDKFTCSPYQMLKRYAKIKKIPFPYSKACFEGSPETRARRMRGDFNSEDRRLMRTPAGDYDTRKFGMRVFNSEEKTVARQMIVEAAHRILGDRPIHYLGLEDQHLSSIRLIREYLNLSPRTSVVVERDNRVFSAMKSLRKHFPGGEGRDLNQVSFRNDSIENVITTLPGPFNLVNLDYVGYLAQSTVDTLRTLMEGRLEDRAIIVVTLQDTPRAKGRTEHAGLGENGARELHRIMKELAGPHYDVAPYGEVTYAGGTGSKQTPMVVLVFDLKRRLKNVSETTARKGRLDSAHDETIALLPPT